MLCKYELKYYLRVRLSVSLRIRVNISELSVTKSMRIQHFLVTLTCPSNSYPPRECLGCVGSNIRAVKYW